MKCFLEKMESENENVIISDWDQRRPGQKILLAQV